MNIWNHLDDESRRREETTRDGAHDYSRQRNLTQATDDILVGAHCDQIANFGYVRKWQTNVHFLCFAIERCLTLASLRLKSDATMWGLTSNTIAGNYHVLEVSSARLVKLMTC